jgi:hypothetical protein
MLGFGRGEALPAAAVAPPPLFPPIANMPPAMRKVSRGFPGCDLRHVRVADLVNVESNLDPTFEDGPDSDS